jgi:hypothetical protein
MFRSERQLSLAAGLNQNAVNNIIASGRASPEALIKIAGALGCPPSRIFVVAGWLDYDGNDNDAATSREGDLLTLFRRLEPSYRDVLFAICQASARGLAKLGSTQTRESERTHEVTLEKEHGESFYEWLLGMQEK